MDIWSTEEGDSGSLLHSRDRQTPSSVRSVQHNSEEKLLGQEVQVYRRRWYMLVMFAMVGFTQGSFWNTWGPISASSELVFGWSGATIALMTNWGPITYIISTPFFTWLMDRKGLRWASIVTMILTTTGMGLRCITSSTPKATYLIHTGQFLNGLGGPVAIGGAPLLSATWFPAEQRTTATAIAAVMNGVGVSISFIIGPLLVPDVSKDSSPSNHSQGNWTPISNHTTEEIHRIRDAIMRLMYYEFGFSALILLIIVMYFPTRPPKPPSISASIERLDYKTGVIELFKHPKFWMLGIPYAVPDGFFNAWISVLDVNLKPLDVSQDTAGWMGFYATLAGNGIGVVVSVFADIFKRRMKAFVLLLYILSAASFTLFTLVYVKIIPFNIELLYASVIIGSMTLMGAVPLFFELTCESTYPIAEGVTNGFLTWLNNIPGLILLLVLMVPSIGKAWTNWSMLGCIIASIPILLLFRERYSRLDIDTHTRGSRGSQASVNGDRDFMDSLGASPRMDNPIYS